MMRFDPFREIEELQQRVDRMFSGSRNGGGQNSFAPTVDVHEDESGLEISLDLPGIAPDQIRLEAENNTITVEAERRYESKEGRNAHRVERAYGNFVRTFNIPARYDLSKIEASQQHGTLTLRVPRSEQAMKRSIPIGAGSANNSDNRTMNASAGGQSTDSSQNAQNMNQGTPSSSDSKGAVQQNNMKG
jgi:HSP20 family protein